MQVSRAVPEIKLSAKRPWKKKDSGLIKLGRHGVCGMAWQWQGPGKPSGIDNFTRVMQKIPVATNKAFLILWQKREICDELIDLFERADRLEFAAFKRQVAGIFAGIGIITTPFPNNYFGIRQGIITEDGRRLEIFPDNRHFSKAQTIFQSTPKYLSLWCKIFDLDLFSLTKEAFDALVHHWNSQGYNITGRIVTGTQVPEGLSLRQGRFDYHVHRESSGQKSVGMEIPILELGSHGAICGLLTDGKTRPNNPTGIFQYPPLLQRLIIATPRALQALNSNEPLLQHLDNHLSTSGFREVGTGKIVPDTGLIDFRALNEAGFVAAPSQDRRLFALRLPFRLSDRGSELEPRIFKEGLEDFRKPGKYTEAYFKLAGVATEGIERLDETALQNLREQIDDSIEREEIVRLKVLNPNVPLIEITSKSRPGPLDDK